MKFNVYTDRAHGWLKVSRKQLQSLGIADKISSHSYQVNDSVYLEEDCDAAVFIDAMKKIGKSVVPVFYNY